MKRSTLWAQIVLLLTVCAVLRFTGLNWDDGIAAHPDERYIVSTAEAMRANRTWDPFVVAPEFPYGHLPLYLLAFSDILVPDVDPLLVGRVFSACGGLVTVFLTYLLGREVLGRKQAFLSASMLSVTAIHVQQAHYYTAECLLTTFTTCSVLFAVRLARRASMTDAVIAGVAAGLAIGTKATGSLLVLPLWASCSMVQSDSRHRWRYRLVCGLAMLLAFAATSPVVLWRLPVFVKNLGLQGAILRGIADVPYTRQYARTIPFLYSIVQQLRWGMGLLQGVISIGGLLFALWRITRGTTSLGELLLLTWAVPYLGFTGALFAKFPRYLLPIIPSVVLFGAQLICYLWKCRRSVGRTMAGMTVLVPFARCVALVIMYLSPHPWVEASDWIQNEVPRGSVIAIEAWDHPLPIYGSEVYRLVEIPIFDDESPSLGLALQDTIDQADYLIIASRRGYAALSRVSARYPTATEHYSRLFNGELGFHPVRCFGRYPVIGPFALADQPLDSYGLNWHTMCNDLSIPTIFNLGQLDESFVVYDHPTTIVLKRVSEAGQPE